MDNNEKKGSEKFSNFLQKASELSKKAADGVQKGAKATSESIKKSLYEQRMKKYNPLFPKQYKSKDFHLPNMIKIVDDAERRGIDVCEGAIGWLGKENNVEVFYLYDEWIQQSGIQFIPAAICNEIYIVDRYDRKRFVRSDSIFEIAHGEKLAELEHIAHSLGAKSCTIEISESSANITDISSHRHANAYLKSSTDGIANATMDYSASMSSSNASHRSGKTTAHFEGNNTPKQPQLKWFAQDDNIKRLIEMRLSSDNSIKFRTLILEGATSATMAQTAACEFDGAIKNMGYKSAGQFEKKAKREYSSKLIFEIEF